MTGATPGGKRTYSKNRRFGPYNGLPSGFNNLNGYQSNRISSKEYNNTLQTFDKGGEQSGLFFNA